MDAQLFSATILLILVLDPFGNLPIVVSVLGKVPADQRASYDDGIARATTPTFSTPSRIVVTGAPEISMLSACDTSCGVRPSARARS